MAHLLVIGASQGIGWNGEGGARRGAPGSRLRPLGGKIALSDPNLERFPGDALSAPDITAALDGVDAVVQASACRSATCSGGAAVLGRHQRAGAGHGKSGVRRLVAVTGSAPATAARRSARSSACRSASSSGRAYDDKDAQEIRIRQSGLDWTLVRPGVLTGGPATGRYQVLDRPSAWKNGLIARADVAQFIVREIETGDHVGAGRADPPPVAGLSRWTRFSTTPSPWSNRSSACSAVRAFYDQPRYAVVERLDRGVEIRSYETRVAVETDGPWAGRRRGLRAALSLHHRRQPGRRPHRHDRPVEAGGQRIAMTVPVEQGTGGTMRFFLPHAVAAAGAPEPTEPGFASSRCRRSGSRPCASPAASRRRRGQNRNGFWRCAAGGRESSGGCAFLHGIRPAFRDPVPAAERSGVRLGM